MKRAAFSAYDELVTVSLISEDTKDRLRLELWQENAKLRDREAQWLATVP